jgi:hypothetical protein
MRGKKAYWVGGTLTALLGVGLVRLLAPALAGFAGSLATVAGYLLAIIGIAIVVLAIRPKDSEIFLTTENEAKD